MKTREEILKILTEFKPELEQQFRVRRLGLFGSYARGEQNDISDVDVKIDA